jgi:hypothetical protein
MPVRDGQPAQSLDDGLKRLLEVNAVSPAHLEQEFSKGTNGEYDWIHYVRLISRKEAAQYLKGPDTVLDRIRLDQGELPYEDYADIFTYSIIRWGDTRMLVVGRPV